MIEKDDIDTLHRSVHTLKGVTGNIGADNLHGYIKEIEKLILDSKLDEFKSEIPVLEEKLSRLFIAIEPFTNKDIRKEQQVVDDTKITELMDVLNDQLNKKSPGAKKTIEELKAVGFQHEYFDTLESAISKYDFKKAIKIFNDIVNPYNNKS